MMKTFATFFRIGVIVAALLLCGVTGSRAALSEYRFTVGSSTLADMTSATNIWTVAPGNRFQAASGVLGIGFTFQFDGADYTQMQVYTSGALSLGTPALFRYPFNDLTNPSVPVIAPFWDSLAMTGNQNNCYSPKIRYKLFGSAPNRMLVVEWFEQETIWGRGSRGTFQARLYETSGKIEMYYESMNHCVTCGPPQQIGLCGSSSASIGIASGLNNYVSVTPNGTAATSSSSTANNAIDLANVNTRISANVLYTFAPNIQLGVQEALDFGVVTAGLVTTACVTVQNVGTVGQLIFQAPGLSGASAFSVSSQPSSPLLPSQTAQYCIDIAPATQGIYSGALTINSNGLDSGTQQVQLTATVVEPVIEIIPLGSNTVTQLFRNRRVRLGDSLEQCFLVKNIGPGQLFISQASYIDGDYPAYYRISRIPSALLDSADVDTMCVVFAPQEEGLTTALLHIVSNAQNGTKDMQLRGVGVRPCIVVEPSPVQFDSVIIGDSICTQIEITNPCTDTLVLEAITVSADPDFTVAPLLKRDSVIPPGQSRFVTVCFKPLARGSRTGRIVFFTNIPLTFESPRRDTGIFYVDIGGTGVPVGKLYADIEGLGWKDSTLVGKKICRQDTIFNLGDAEILITQAMLRGADAADFTLSGISLPYLLKAKSFVVLTLCATPSARGERIAQLYISGSSSDIPDSIVANLNVKGLLVCASNEPDSLFLGVTLTNMSDTSIVIVTNCGDVPADYTGIITGPEAGNYTLINTSTGVISPGGSGTFTVAFSPLTRGPKPATLRIAAPDVATMTVVLGGEGACAVPAAAATVAAPTTPTALTNPIFFYVVITNTGNFAWNVGTPVVTGDTVFHYIAAGSATVIRAGGMDSIKISFQPHEPTIYRAQITFPESGPCAESELVVNLVGEGFTSSVKDVRTANGFVLGQNVPNPTSGMTSLSYTVPQASQVRIVLTDVTGKMVRELVNAKESLGTHEVQLSTSDLPSGTYLYIMEAGAARLVRQLVVTK